MQMTLRWYGSKYDTVTLKQIRQIPGVTGVISTLYGTAPGEVWEMDDILALKTEIEAAGLQLAGTIYRELYHYPGTARSGRHPYGMLQFHAGL